MSANLRAYTQGLYSFDHVVRLLPDRGGPAVTMRRLVGPRRRRSRHRRATLDRVPRPTDRTITQPIREPGRHRR